MEKSPLLIKGGHHEDERGRLIYNNNFNLFSFNIKRCYSIMPKGLRAWQGHQKEQKWFMALEGIILLLVIKPDNWENPSFDLKVNKYILKANDGDVLHVPEGFITGMKPITTGATLMVYSDFTLEESLKDDYRFDKERWHYNGN